ncbi:hypothetical protein BN2537_6065 [Streptomyces venezuelae]|nr:hypothetical protein BN2537_6065 [Streptomyces venezuelae]
MGLSLARLWAAAGGEGGQAGIRTPDTPRPPAHSARPGRQ